MTASNPTRAALEAALASARATVASLEAAIAALDAGVPADELLDLSGLKSAFGLGRAAVLGAVARGELVASRGARDRILVTRSAVHAWLARPVEVRCRKAPAASVTDLAAWERKQQEALSRARGSHE